MINRSLILLFGATSASACATSQASTGDDRASAMFDRMDTNSDGSITFAEVRDMRSMMFDRADTDGDGFLSTSEADSAQASTTARRGAVGGRGGSRQAGSLDANGDGVVSRQEFAEEIGMLKRVDQNGDDAISQAEWQQMRERIQSRRGRRN